MRNYKSTLEHFIALRRGERKSRYTGYTSCEEGGGVGIRRTEHFFTDRDKMGGGNAEWVLVERTTLFIAKNSRHAPVRRKPAFWWIPGTLSGRKRRKKKPRFNGWNRALLFSSPFGRKYIYIYGDSKGENRIPGLRKRSRLILPRCKREFFLGGGWRFS